MDYQINSNSVRIIKLQRKLAQYAFAGLTGLMALAAAGQSNLYVAMNGIDNDTAGRGQSWSSPYLTISNGVAHAGTAGDTVWVSNGTYVLTTQIVITNGITLRSTNGPDVTIINGGFVAGNPTTNRCLLMSNVAAFVHGFTISNGAYCPIVGTDGGGGVRMYSGILSNCTVRNNIVFTSGSLTYLGGGGIYMKGIGGTTIVCRVTDNIVTNLAAHDNAGGGGGGIFCSGLGFGVFDCLISNNFVYGYGNQGGGGGVMMASGSRTRSCMICDNRCRGGFGGSSPLGGGFLLTAYGSSDPSVIEACTITRNNDAAAEQAGGCYLAINGTVTGCVFSFNIGNGIVTRPNGASYALKVYNTTIISNTAIGVHLINPNGGTNLIVNCDIIDNNGRGVYMLDQGNNSLLNCTVRGNKGGGVECLHGTIRNCLITKNINSGNFGGLLIGSVSTMAMVSCSTIVSNMNTIASLGAGIRFENTNSLPGIQISVSSCIICSNGIGGTNDVYDACAPTNYGTLKYSCVGTNNGFTGAGIIVANPQFADFAGGNWRLTPNSPCINTGSNETSWMINSFDRDGLTRIRYGTVDMGAYELLYVGTIYKVH